MTTVIKIRKSGDLQKAVDSLKRMRTQLPKMTAEVMMQWGKTLERDTKEAAVQAGIKSHTGELLGRGIEYRQRPNGRVGSLFIRDYGVKLDSMTPHFVNITRDRSRFLSWGLQSQSAAIRAGSRRVASGQKTSHTVFVRPHPFIRNGFRRARPKLRPIIKQHTKRTLNNV